MEVEIRVVCVHELKRSCPMATIAHFLIDRVVDPVGQNAVHDGGEHEIEERFHTTGG
jgi:hypothetical protein